MALVLSVMMILGIMAVPAQAASASKPCVYGDTFNIFFVDAGGDFWCWGYNRDGRIDPNNRSQKIAPTKISENVIAVSGMLMLKNDGTVYQMERENLFHQTKIMSDVVAIGNDISYDANFALDKNGNLYSWGINYHGALGFEGGEEKIPGQGTGGSDKGWIQRTPYKILDNVQDFYTFDYGGYAIKKDGSLWAWGRSAAQNFDMTGGDSVTSWFGQPDYYYTNPVKVMDGVKDLATDGKTIGGVSVIKLDNSLWSTQDFGKTWSKVIDNVAKALYEDDTIICLKQDGTLWGWGKARLLGIDGDTQVESGTGYVDSEGMHWDYDAYQSTPVLLMDQVASIGLGSNALFAVKKDGTLWGIGSSEYGQIKEDETRVGSWTQISLPDHAVVAVSGNVGTVTAPNKPSAWAQEIVSSAQAIGAVPKSVRQNYQANITRAQFAELIVQSIELTGMEMKRGEPFSDCSFEYVCKAREAGIIGGTGNNQFNPNAPITREELAMMIVSAAKYMDSLSEIDRFYGINDAEAEAAILASPMYADVSDWAKSSMRQANDQGFIQGDGNSLNPKGNATCEQSILIVYRASEFYWNLFGYATP